MIKVSDTSIIYIVCPTKLKTGGPELLHQLFYKLRLYGKNAVIYYFNKEGHEDPIPEDFKIYNVEYTDKIIDNPNNILIVPETRSYLLFRYFRIQKVIWWLSVDNFARPRVNRSFIKKLYHGIFKFNTYHSLNRLKKIPVTFFAQSYYAIDYLQRNGFNDVHYLSDYLSSVYFDTPVIVDFEQKRDWVVYNPKKGIEFTKKVIEASIGIEWIPLQGMSSLQVRTVLSQAKVYIDFGDHPGKDRIPREAAVSGCCIITGRRGSSAFPQDVAIPEKFKIADTAENIPLIVERIVDCLINYKTVIESFDSYVGKIKREELEFDDAVKAYFKITDNI